MKTILKYWKYMVAGLVIIIVFLVARGTGSNATPATEEKTAVVTPAQTPTPVVESPEVTALKQQNELLKRQMEGMQASLSVARENELPSGVKVSHMPERTLKESPWKFLKWDKQGKYVFPLIANSSGNPTPIRSAVPPPPGSIPGKALPGERWTLADWEVSLPDGTKLALNGWARE